MISVALPNTVPPGKGLSRYSAECARAGDFSVRMPLHDSHSVYAVSRRSYANEHMVHFFQDEGTCNGTYDTCIELQVGGSNE